jgi:hypothetical protein
MSSKSAEDFVVLQGRMAFSVSRRLTIWEEFGFGWAAVASREEVEWHRVNRNSGRSSASRQLI